MNPNFCRPEDLIVTNLLVPPICIRPSVVTQGSSGSNEDDLTVKLGEIVLTNNTIRIAMEKGGGVLHILEDWMMLQAHVTTYFNADNIAAQQIIAGNRNQKPKPMRRCTALCASDYQKPHALQISPLTAVHRSFYQRLKGKQGRFRGNLSGQ
jgi:DNA-directed RNA polymerase III subunit RPC1